MDDIKSSDTLFRMQRSKSIHDLVGVPCQGFSKIHICFTGFILAENINWYDKANNLN